MGGDVLVLSWLMANAEGFRLVRCPNCLNVLPEPHNVTVYRCGGCGTTLRAKICASGGRHASAKQARQDSDSYSVAYTAVSNGNGAPPQNKDQASESSFGADAPSTEHGSNGAGSGENGGGVLAAQNAVVVAHDAENKENHTVEQPTENSETCRAVSGHDDDTERRLNASEKKTVSSEMSKAAVSVQDPEQKEEGGGEHAANNKKGYLVKVLSRSCDLRSSRDSTDFQSARTSLQSKSFSASEPLQSKIMNTVDELKGDLSELFSNKPADDCKPKAHQPPRPSKQDGRTTRAAIASSAPLAAYHPAAKHSGYVSRPSKSGQVAAPSRGLPSLRYRRHGVYPFHFHHNVQTDTRPCRHGCCHHSCQQPPCYRYRPCKQEPAATRRPPVMVSNKRPPPPRNYCLPVLRGAPFVICSSCVSLVQLPAEFAVPSRGTRRLRCGSCSEVLSYSYRDPGARKRLQSPFGGDEYEQAAGGHNAAAGFFGEADPVSYSEEYGLSFGIGHSTSTEDGQQPLYVSRNSSFNTVDERTGTRDGKLHRLMGYSSASEVLQHSPDLFESFGRRAADAGRAHVGGKGKGVCVAENDACERDGGAVERSKVRSGGWPVHGILKKGIHGLESLKLRS